MCSCTDDALSRRKNSFHGSVSPAVPANNFGFSFGLFYGVTGRSRWTRAFANVRECRIGRLETIWNGHRGVLSECHFHTVRGERRTRTYVGCTATCFTRPARVIITLFGFRREFISLKSRYFCCGFANLHFYWSLLPTRTRTSHGLQIVCGRRLFAIRIGRNRSVRNTATVELGEKYSTS